jgi:hypothetical protein
LNLFKRFLEHRHLPIFLALGAIVVMLPALKVGLVADDLPQRAVALKPSQLPPRMHETGNPADSGTFSTVINDYFFSWFRHPQNLALAKNYGMLPWWTPDNVRVGLWRPLTAFTHWLDYQLYPDSPALMHAQNIAWFAAILFLLAIIYRQLMDVKWAAGLAALLFLLDGNTYFPVMFVANRGFILSLFLGLVCFYEHHQWRSNRSRHSLILSMLFLALSLFANEGGASTFAFILAYALVLETGGFWSRALTILPSIVVIVAWRAIYETLGFGLHNVILYIDPIHNPLQFAGAVLPRALVLLGAQIAYVPPELLFVVKPSLMTKAEALYCVPLIAAVAILLPLLRRNKMAVFWFAVMLLAAIPAATVAPLSKNLGFVAVGAYGLMATFIASLVNRQLPTWRPYRVIAWIACVLLLIAHVPGAVVSRAITAWEAPPVFERMDYYGNVCSPPDAENKNIIVINAPTGLFLAYTPACKAYHHQPLPRTARTLVPGCSSLTIQRTDDRTLVIQSRATNLFACEDLGPYHVGYAMAAWNGVLGETKTKPGDQLDLGMLKVEILQTDASGLPSRVAFHFDHPLDSPDFHWVKFDWQACSYQSFNVPPIGGSDTLPGAALYRKPKVTTANP